MPRLLPSFLIVVLAAGAVTAQATIFIPDNDPTEQSCNVIPFGYGTSPTWTPQTYVGRIAATFLDPANPYFDEISFAPCGSGPLTATDFQVALGHIPPHWTTMNFPNCTTGALGDFLDLTVVYDSDVSGGLSWTVSADTWNPLGYAAAGGTGFTWNGVDDVGLYITQRGMNNAANPIGFHTSSANGIEPFRWEKHGAGGYQAVASVIEDYAGLKVRIDCSTPVFTLTATTTPGTGNLQLSLTGIPPGTNQGWTLASSKTSVPVGGGPWILGGLYMSSVAAQWALVLAPPSPTAGDLFHWIWPVSSPLYPAAAFSFPAGSFPPSLYGTSWDLVGIAAQGSSSIWLTSAWWTTSNIERMTW